MPISHLLFSPKHALTFIQWARAAINSAANLRLAPQSISVITRGLLEDQGAANRQDTLRYIADVFANTYSHDNQGDCFYSAHAASWQPTCATRSDRSPFSHFPFPLLPTNARVA